MGFKKGEGGRPKGVKNKASGEIQRLARQHTPAALKELVRLSTKAESEQARVAACREILDRGYGRPQQAVTVSGDEDAPLVTRVIHQEADGY